LNAEGSAEPVPIFARLALPELQPNAISLQWQADGLEKSSYLLLLLDVNRMFSQTWTELFELQLLATCSTSQRIVVITAFLAYEVNDFFFSLALGHNSDSFTLF
jgi:hypothetical protein